MKKLLLTIGLAATTFTSFAQDFWSDHSFQTKITFGLIFGSDINFPQLNSPGMNVDYLDYSTSISNVFGVNADFKFGDYFSIRPGITYIGKKAGLNSISSDNNLQIPISITEQYQFNYLEIPLNFIGHIPFSSGANIFLGAGPYIAKGMNASVKATISGFDPVKQKLTYGSNGDLKSTDYGLTTVIGFQTAGGWAIGANLDIGRTNIIQNNSESDAGSIKMNTLYFNIGKSF